MKKPGRYRSLANDRHFAGAQGVIEATGRS
jgi:hypothetical protein